MPVAFRLVNHMLAGLSLANPGSKSISSSNLALQDLILADAGFQKSGNKTMFRGRKRLSIRSLSVPVIHCKKEGKN